MTHPRADAALFEMIDGLLDEQRAADEPGERRLDERRIYQCTQLLAPYDGCRLPQPADFLPLLCRDLSPRGFSFVSQRRPEHPYVVIGLGTVPFKFFTAAIRNIRPFQQHGKEKHVVGCQILQRLTST